MYPPLHSYYSAGQCLPYTSQPAFVAPSASMYCSSAVTDTNMQFQYPQDPQPVQIHAPVPLSAYTSLLPGTPDSGSQPTPRPSAMPSPFEDVSQVTSGSSPSQERSPLDHYINAPPATFPTPCDLLNEMSSRDRLTCTVPSGASSSHQPPRDLPTALVSVKSKPERKQSEKRPENQRKAYFRTVAETVGFQPTNP